MKSNFLALIVGFIFSLGLGIAGMTQPAKIIGFLDIFGRWDPSLMFVMIGAIAVHLVSYRLVRKKKKPLFVNKWQIPDKKQITLSLVAGSFLFGTGWGLAGYCPGPAITSLASFEGRPLMFVGGLLIGMVIFRWADQIFQFKK